MVEPHTEQAEALISQEDVVHSLDPSEEKQAVMEVTRLVTETEIEHGGEGEVLESTTETLDANSTSDVVHDVGRAQAGSDLAINIMSHMEISRLIANVVKRMQEEGAQSGISSHNLFHMENLLKQVVTNQNTITINQNSLLRNQQAMLQKELDETWKGMRWLLDILHYSRDRESVSGIPLDLVFDTRRPCSPEPYDPHRKHSERKSSTNASNGEKSSNHVS